MLNSRRVFVLVAGAILFYQLILPPIVGLSDNGDFGKVIGRFGLEARVHKHVSYIDVAYDLHPERGWKSGFSSTEIPLAQLAVWLNSAISKDGSFDLRSIGVIHGALFLLAVWLFVPLLDAERRAVRWGTCALALFFFCDMMYVAGLNSFYMDEPAYLFLLLTAVAYLRVIRFGRWLDGILLIVFSLLAVTAKAQHAPVCLLVAALFVFVAKELKALPRTHWYAGAACLTIVSGLMMWKAQPSDYASYPLYNVVFDEILPHSNNVGRTMADLGLDDSFRPHIGQVAFQPTSGMFDPAFHQRFMQELSYGKLAVFYVKHPGVAYRTMVDLLSEAGRQHTFGNFDISAGYPPYTESEAFSLWSGIKRYFFFQHGQVFLFAFLALAALLNVQLWLNRGRLPSGAVPGGLCLVAAALIEMCLATLGDSMDAVRHSTIFFALFDMIVLGCAWFALRSQLPKNLAFALADRARAVAEPAPAELSVEEKPAPPVEEPAAPVVAAPAPVAAAPTAPAVPPPPAPDMRLVDRCLTAAGALILAVYFFRLTRPTLRIYFSPDDLMNLYRSWIFPVGHLVKANLLFFLASDYGRPMGSLWYRAIFAFTGFHAFWFHATNLAILAANIWLTYVVARRLAGSREIAALTALAMAYQQPLLWLYYNTGFIYDVLCYFFLFAALALYLRVRDRDEALRPWQWTALFALYICALNTKEMATMLPAFLGCYELLYHTPRAWQPAALRRWLLREGRATLITGAVAVLFVIGRSVGPLSLTNNAAYKPSFTLSQFLFTSGHFVGDYLGVHDWPAWAVLMLWAALAAIAWAARSRVLGFAWLFLMFSPLPVAFIMPRGAAQYYVCIFGWMLYAAVLVSRLAALLLRDDRLPEWWMSRVRGAALFLLAAALLYSAYKPLSYEAVIVGSREPDDNRNTVATLHAAAPVIRPNSSLLFLNDPIPANWFNLIFIVQLSYYDPTLHVFRVKEMKQPPTADEIAKYDYVFDYRDRRFYTLKQP